MFPLRRRDRRYRNLFIQIIPAVEWLRRHCWCWHGRGGAGAAGSLRRGLTLQAGSLQSLLALVSAFLWAATGLNCPNYFAAASGCNRFYFFWLMTLGALMGVFLSADLFTLFVFFEMMSFTSYVWVAQNETPEAIRAGQTYLAVAVIGGMALLAGLLLLRHLLGTLTFAELQAAVNALPAEKRTTLYVAGGLALTGFGAKAGMFPLAYLASQGPSGGAGAGIGAAVRIPDKERRVRCADPLPLPVWAEIPWNTAVLALGVVTMVLGAVLALFSVDLTTAWPVPPCPRSVSSCGGRHAGLPDRGERAGGLGHGAAHAQPQHQAGAVCGGGRHLCGDHSLDLNEIRGWGRNKPVLKALFFVGAASIAGVPGFSGYVQQDAAPREHCGVHPPAGARRPGHGWFPMVERLFLIAGGLTAAYMTKLFVAIFISDKPAGQRPALQTYLSRGTLNGPCRRRGRTAASGLTPGITMEPLARWAGEFLMGDAGHSVNYFSWVNLKGALISLGIGAAVYLLVVRWLLETESEEPVYLTGGPGGWIWRSGCIAPPSLPCPSSEPCVPGSRRPWETGS